MKWFFSKSQRKLWHDSYTGAVGQPAQMEGWSCEARNDVIPGCTGLPIGTYTLGTPEYNEPEETTDLRAMGAYFVPVNDVPNHDGIGLHAGATAAPHPLAAKQGWYPTENCIRLQTDDLYHFVQNVTAGDILEVIA